jgi:RHS repeat-associated protein
LKGVNSLNDGVATHLPSNDMGGDGNVNNNDIYHQKVGKDVFGFTLHYFKGDYTPIKNDNAQVYDASKTASLYTSLSAVSLYNGNIAAMRTAIHVKDATQNPQISANPVQQIMAYRYDQLNRITKSNALNGTTMALTQNYAETYVYDPNGNILNLTRKNGAALSFDELTYQYDQVNPATLRKNQLLQVLDLKASNITTNDIDNQNANNYVYDEIGNLIQDESENITNIVWSIYGKVLEVKKDDGINVTTIAYDYDATGNRVAKIVKIGIKELINGGTSTSIRFNKENTTAYFRDAQGNVLQTTVKNWKEDAVNGVSVQYKSEYVIYGSSRLGTYEPEKSPYYSGYQGITKGKLTLGYKNYELSNHLGNVLTTIADNKFFAAPASGTGLSLFARVATSQDYYPFGMAMAERSFKENTDKKYRFGFNGKEYENDISEGVYNFEARMMDSRICRFTSTDPKTKPFESPYVAMGNNPIIYTDPDGKENIIYIYMSPDAKATLLKKGSNTQNVANAVSYLLSVHGISKENGYDVKIQFVEKPLTPAMLDLSDAFVHIENVGNPKDTNQKLMQANEQYATSTNDSNIKKTDVMWDFGKGGRVDGIVGITFGNSSGKYDVNKEETHSELLETGYTVGQARTLILVNGSSVETEVLSNKMLNEATGILGAVIVHELMHSNSFAHCRSDSCTDSYMYEKPSTSRNTIFSDNGCIEAYRNRFTSTYMQKANLKQHFKKNTPAVDNRKINQQKQTTNTDENK